ncbi:MAG TPA: HD domain-containing protein [Candidatus Saccharimonadales bacterium]|jgi:putative hydrolase of HD superfamily
MDRDLEFLYEIGAVRLIPRQWHRFHMGGVANLADHHFRVAWLALVIAAREGVKVDDAKMLKMALAHDIAESRTGDVDYLARQYVERDESKGLADMLADTSVHEEIMQLVSEYEERGSLEAKIVKDADNLDVDMELQEQAAQGHTLPGDWRKNRELVGRTKLYTDTARKIQAAIFASNPHDWHLKSPSNRVNGGDWKPKQSKGK